jgi:urease accessory protein
VEPNRLLIRRDHVLENMLRQLGATLTLVTEPFTPEGGAYGTGRTMGHAHGPETPPHAHEETFGWHDHGDGRMHFHAPKR